MWVIMSGCFLESEYLHITASVSQMVRKRSRAVEFQEEDLDRSPSPPLVIHRHTDVELNTLNPGRQPRRARTSYVSLPKSPEKNRGTTALSQGNHVLPDEYSYDSFFNDSTRPLSGSESDSDSDDSEFDAMDPSKNKPLKPCTVSGTVFHVFF